MTIGTVFKPHGHKRGLTNTAMRETDLSSHIGFLRPKKLRKEPRRQEPQAKIGFCGGIEESIW